MRKSNNGVYNLSWEDLKARLEELEGHPVDITKRTCSLAKLKELIAAHFITEDTLPQIQPMLAYDVSDEDWDQYNNSNYAIEPKINGVRMLMFISNGKVRFQTRGRNKYTQLFTERTENYPHYFNLSKLDEYDGTILDGEMVMFSRVPDRKKELWRDNDLALTMSVNGASPEHAVEEQKRIGKARFIAFDILSVGGIDVISLPQRKRRKLLEKTCKELGLDIVPEWIPGKVYSIKERYEAVTKSGGEGLMLKDRNSIYENRRSRSWLKVKRFDEEVAFIHSIYKMGSRSIEGLVGSVLVVDKNGDSLGIVSSLSLEMRKELLGEDGKINRKYVGRPVLIRYHVRDQRTGNLHHARIIKWLDSDNE